eukprot:gene5216-gene5753
MRFVFVNNVKPTNKSNGDVPVGGTLENNGQKKIVTRNNIPHTKVLNPVRAPALIPAAVSGDNRIGGPEKKPLMMVATPQMMNSQWPRGMVSSTGCVSNARSLMDRDNPFNVRMYKNKRLAS